MEAISSAILSWLGVRDQRPSLDREILNSSFHQDKLEDKWNGMIIPGIRCSSLFSLICLVACAVYNRSR